MPKEDDKLEAIRELAQESSNEALEKGKPMARNVGGWLRVAFVENAGLKIVALVLALTVFILVHSEEKEVSHPLVQITYIQDSDRILVSKAVNQVQISVRGTRRRIERLQKESLERVRIDLRPLSSGELRLQPEMFRLPDGIELIANLPSINLQFDERDVKMLPVTVDTVGMPASGFKLGRVDSSPSEVRVTGARSVLEGMESVVTKTVNLSNRTKTFEGPVDLIRGDVSILDSDAVQVTVQIVEELQRRVLEAKSIRLVNPGLELNMARFALDPQTVIVTMYGETHALGAIDSAKVSVYVELGAEDVSLSGTRMAEIKIEPRLSDIAYTITPSEVVLRAAPPKAVAPPSLPAP